MKRTKRQDTAKMMADLTFQMERACQAKETYFAGKFDLTPAEFRCLRHLKDVPHLTIRELAGLMDLTSGRITHIITSLEKKKYLIREIDPNDRRSIKVMLTKESIPKIQDIIQKHIQLHEEILKNTSLEKANEIVTILQELVEALNAWTKSRKDLEK